MEYYYIQDDPRFKKPKYNRNIHPVRFSFFKAKMSVKEQNRLLEYLEEKLEIKLRVKRENGLSIFMSSEFSNKKAAEYVFHNSTELMNEFDFKEVFFDLTILQK